MAKRKGFTVSMDNSDNDQRKFDILCDVAVNEEGQVKVNSVSVSKNGVSVTNVNIQTFIKGNPNVNVSFNFHNLPFAEHAECVTAVYDFVEQAMEAAVNE